MSEKRSFVTTAFRRKLGIGAKRVTGFLRTTIFRQRALPVLFTFFSRKGCLGALNAQPRAWQCPRPTQLPHVGFELGRKAVELGMPVFGRR